MKGAINYNEQKVKEGKAIFLAAIGYSKAEESLHFYDKWRRLQKLASLNERTTTNCIHLSLNFHPSEKLGKALLLKIADSYMNKIGFGGQPYLVYQHIDTAHLHFHIVTTNIQKDGSRIALHNLGRGLSEKARKEIEIAFGLVRAGNVEDKLFEVNLPEDATARYGKVETKRAISSIVRKVVDHYSFASLPELNAALQSFHVVAYRGEEGSRMFQKNGLVYSFIDDAGRRIGVPIKASRIYDQPTLQALQKKFEKGSREKIKSRSLVTAKIQSVLLNKIQDLRQFKDLLYKQHVSLVCRYNMQGFLYGVTYVDHKGEIVFNGSDLGKQYSAASLRERWKEDIASNPKVVENCSAKDNRTPVLPSQPSAFPDSQTGSTQTLWQTLSSPDHQINYVPYELKKKRKKKRNFHL